MHPAGPEEAPLPAHRSEALSDGVFAIAMTLLVIELKLPEPPGGLHSSAQLLQSLGDLVPKLIAWAISFLVLAIFWLSHHRVFAHLRRADSRLLQLNLGQLAFVTLMPFSCAMVGEHGSQLVSQGVYSFNMAMLGVFGLLLCRHVHAHPELCSLPMPRARYEGARMRISGLIVISIVAIGIAWIVPIPGVANAAFMLMAVIGPLSRRLERRVAARTAGLAPLPPV